MADRKLTAAETALAEPAILARMRQTPTFTFRDLYCAADAVLGWQGSYRLADRLIQRERASGRIAQTAKRGVWSALSPTLTQHDSQGEA